MISLNSLSSEKKAKLVYLLIFVASLSALLPYLYACFYIHPHADDFWFAGELDQKGRIGFAADFYQNWSGRYFANFLLSIPKSNILSSGWLYTALPIVFVSLTLLMLYRFVRLFSPDSYSKKKAVTVALFLTAFYVTGLYEMFSALYWNCSSYYLLANFFFLWLILELAKFQMDKKTLKSVGFIKIAVLIGLCAGLTEIYIISLFVVLGIMSLLYLKANSKISVPLAIFLLLVIIGGYFNIFSPGAQNRMELSEAQNGFVYSSVRAAYDLAILQIAPVVYNGQLLLLFLLFTLSDRIIDGNKRVQSLLSVNPWLTLLVILFVFYLHHAASIYGAGYTIQGRVLNITSLLFFLALAFWVLNLAHHKKSNFNISPSIVLGAVALVAVLMNFSVNSRVIVKESLVDMKMLNAELNARYETIEKAKNEGRTKVAIDRVHWNPRALNNALYDPDFSFYNSLKCTREMSHFFNLEIVIKDDQYDLREWDDLGIE